MVLVASIRGLGQSKTELDTREEREASARRWGNKLFIPALVIPIGTVLGTILLKRLSINGSPLVDLKQVTVISLAIATIIALTVGMLMLRPPLFAPIREARRLLDAVGWAAVLHGCWPRSVLCCWPELETSSRNRAALDPARPSFAVVTTYAIGMAISP
jgi:uncharacterized membrane protein